MQHDLAQHGLEHSDRNTWCVVKAMCKCQSPVQLPGRRPTALAVLAALGALAALPLDRGSSTLTVLSLLPDLADLAAAGADPPPL